jgi:hypothetical protein
MLMRDLFPFSRPERDTTEIESDGTRLEQEDERDIVEILLPCMERSAEPEGGIDDKGSLCDGGRIE